MGVHEESGAVCARAFLAGILVLAGRARVARCAVGAAGHITITAFVALIGGTFFWIIMQILLMPVRLIKKEDPLIKFKILFGIEPKAEPAVLKETAEVEESAPPPADS